MIEQNLFLEWAQFAGNYYGTPLFSVNEKIKNGLTVLLEIEVEGARQIKNKFPSSLSIFLLPPDKEELERRIRNRGCLLYTSPSPRDNTTSRMPSSA